MARPLTLGPQRDQPIRRHVRIEDEVAAALAEIAVREHRTLFGQVNHVLREWLDEYHTRACADDAAA